MKEEKQELSDDHKNYNKNHSKKRIVIEHTICRLKKFSRILAADVFKNKLRKYNKVLDIVSGQVNYRIINHYY
ncbi:MAG TPA: transposase family protein [Candidatus Sulfopaludibacter sp.]|nr:transposase family protein [Candidatus Sulfopaludibacter sp.]